MTAALSKLPLYESISDVTALQTRTGVNQQLSYDGAETAKTSLFLTVPLLQRRNCVFFKGRKHLKM